MIFGKYINKYYKKYWYNFVFGFLSLVIIDVLQLFIPQLISEMVEKLQNLFNVNNPLPGVIVTGPIWGGNENNLFHLNDYAYYFGGITLLVFVISVLRFVWRYTLYSTQIKIECAIREEMYVHVENLTTEFFNSQKTGGLLAYFSNDIESLTIVFSDGIIYIVDVFVLGVLAFTKMCMVNWLLSIVCIIPMIILTVMGFYFEKIESKKHERRHKAFEDISDMVNENLSGISVIKAFVREISESRRFAELNKKNKMVSVDLIKYRSLIDVGFNLFIYICIIAIILLGGMMIVNPDIFNQIPGTGTLDTKGLTAFLGYYDSLIWPMIAIGMLVSTISQSNASKRRIETLLDAKNDIYEPEDNKAELVPFVGSIKFNNFSFCYPDNKSVEVLKNITIDIPNGTNVGIVGKTGCGKTTFVNSLLKIYNIDRGMISINGIDVNDYNSKYLRDHIGYVSQDTFLFSESIEENIGFSLDNIDSEESKNKIIEAAKFSCVHENIEEFTDKYETMLGERGVTLSGGQKQRVSIARAIIKEPEILILDDSVSAVDSNTEKEILSNIKEKRKNKTTLIIAHRISALEDLDLILVLDEGKLIDYGKHEYLKEHCELYKSLCKLQSLQKEV